MATNNGVNGWREIIGTGNPNGSVAGSVGDQYFDNSGFGFYICTTAGNSSGAVWTIQGGASSGGVIQARLATTSPPVGTYVNNGGVGDTFTITATGTFSVDGVVTALNDLVVIKSFATSTAFQNGLWLVTRVGATGIQQQFTRSTLYDTPTKINANLPYGIQILAGSTQTFQRLLNTAPCTTMGTSPIYFGYMLIGDQLLTPATTTPTSIWVAGVNNAKGQWIGSSSSSGQVLSNTGGTLGFSSTLPSGLTIPQPIIQGVTSNTAAGSGAVGQYVSSVITTASPVTITTSGTPQNVTSISLGAGDWDVWGNVTYIANGATTLGTNMCWISSSSATLPDTSLIAGTSITVTAPGTGSDSGFAAPGRQFLLSGATTIFLSTRVVFAAGAQTVSGGIYARRRQ